LTVYGFAKERKGSTNFQFSTTVAKAIFYLLNYKKGNKNGFCGDTGYSAPKYTTIPLQYAPPIPGQSTPVCKGCLGLGWFSDSFSGTAIPAQSTPIIPLQSAPLGI